MRIILIHSISHRTGSAVSGALVHFHRAEGLCRQPHERTKEEHAMIMVADRIKSIREQNHLTQSELAKRLGITRSSVNAWEMGISVPSTQYLTELASLFHVSTDYLLGIDGTSTIDISGLTDEDKFIVLTIIRHLREKNN